ncbi:unnamed protein product [Sphagnum jensenii]|uniref:Patatin n=1 Tax=Sphagnum jensenii TaxID=128206 RepID=A0ABP0X040_9BRYO
MITTPKLDNSQVPTCNASQVVEFFEKDAARIFPATFTDKCRLRWLFDGFASVFGPIYRAKPLEDLLSEKFGDRRLSDALTSVIIPAFDTNNEVPVFFSKLQGVDTAKPLYNDVRVKDACRATTAVPIFFPVASVKEVSVAGPKEFNVIDAGIAVNDPTLVAVTQAIAKKRQALAEELSRDCMDFSNVLVLSLGTGEHPIRFLAKPQWGSVQWLLNPSGSPLLNSFLSASEDMVEYYTSMIFDAHQSGHHYLRIQTERLSSSEFWGIDDSTRQNLVDLKQRAGELLDGRYVSRRNFATGGLDAITDGGTNREALDRFARWLFEERRARPRPTAPPILPPALPGNFNQQRAVDRLCLMMRTAVAGCCLKLGAVLGGFCLMMRTAIAGCFLGTAIAGFYLMMLAFITSLCVLCLPFFYLLDFIYGVASEIVRAALRIGS